MAANIRRDSPQRNRTRAGKILEAAILCACFAFSGAGPAAAQWLPPQEYVFPDDGFAVTSSWEPERIYPSAAERALVERAHQYAIRVDGPVHMTCFINVIRGEPGGPSDEELIRLHGQDHPDATKVLQGKVMGLEFSHEEKYESWITRMFVINHISYSISAVYDDDKTSTKKRNKPSVPAAVDVWLNSFQLLDAGARK